MSVRRDKERGDKSDRRSTIRDTSTRKKPRDDASKDRRTVATSDKPSNVKTRASKDSNKPEKHSHVEVKVPKKGTDVSLKDKRTEKKSATAIKMRGDSKTDLIYLKDVIEKKAAKREEERKLKKAADERSNVDSVIKTKDDERTKLKRDRTRTRTLSPTEIKQLLPSRMASGDQVRREEVILVPQSLEIKETEDGNDEYENDFEDYESDFEEDESQPSEHSKHTDSSSTIDSTSQSEEEEEETEKDESIPQQEPGKPENETTECETSKTSPKAWKQTMQKRHLEDIRKSIEKENTEVTERRASLTISLDSAEEPEQSSRQTGEHLIDFSVASKKQKNQKKAAAAKKRGRELLNMITLDTITYSILEIPPIPYESYMRTFGKSNTKQAHVQTNEDNLEEEIQTEEIQTTNKWTQYPPEYLGSKKNQGESVYTLSKEERLGVGGDEIEKAEDKEFSEEVIIQPLTSSLLNFLSWSSQVVLGILEKKSGNFLNLETMPHHSKGIAFGDGFVKLKTQDISLLTGKSVVLLSLLNSTNKKLLTVHATKGKRFQRCFICVWSFRELSKPLKILITSNLVTSCSFGPNLGNFVFAGLTDGSICLWDLRESSIYHNNISDDAKWTVQSPTYTTAGNLQETNQFSSIIFIQLLSSTEGFESFNDFIPMQICSLDETGNIGIWSVIQLDSSLRNEPSTDLGLAHWGRLKLIKSSSFCIFDTIREEIPNLYVTCNDMLINTAEDDGFYIANSFGSVHHVSSYGSSMKPNFYVPSKQDTIVAATCLELCPFDGNYFLVGCGDGSIRYGEKVPKVSCLVQLKYVLFYDILPSWMVDNVDSYSRLHSRHQETPLITLNSNVIEGERQTSVSAICWLTTRPCVFFSLDSKSKIHVWDLGVSDMYPEMTLVLTDKKILSMKLLANSSAKQVPFIVLGMEDGTVEIHRVKKEYGLRSETEIATERRMFLKYVSIL